MSNIEIVQSYFKEFYTGKARHSTVRRLLTDDFRFRDPMMSADTPGEYIDQLQQYGDEMELYAEIRSLAEKGDIVAALVEFQGPAGPMTYSMWFTLKDGKFSRIESVYDPRPFLEYRPGPRR